MKYSPRYVVNAKGERIEVILSITSFEELMQDLSDLAAVADRRNEATIPHDEFIAELKQDGILQS